MRVLFKGNNLLSKLSLPIAFKSAGADPAASHAFADLYREVAGADTDRALRLVRGDKQGISSEEAARRLQRVGFNELAHEKKDGWFKQLWETSKTPFNIFLVVLAVSIYWSGDPTSGCVVGAMVVLSVLLTFFQEYRSNQAAERLQAMVTTTVSVLRREEMEFGVGQRLEKITRTEKREVPLEGLVPGDLVQLSAGDMIPADVRVLTAKDLFVSQAALTGESLPVEKIASPAMEHGRGHRAEQHLLHGHQRRQRHGARPWWSRPAATPISARWPRASCGAARCRPASTRGSTVHLADDHASCSSWCRSSS